MDASLQPATPPPPLGGQPPLGGAQQPQQPDQKQPPAPAPFSTGELQQKYAQTEDKLAAINQETGALQPPKLETPPPPVPKTTNPAEIWGSAAMAMAALGSLMTRTPMTTALNSAAAVMKAVKANDNETAQAEFERWKIENENAIKQQNFQMEAYKSALAKAGKDETAAIASFTAYAHAFGDHTAAQVAQQNGYIGIQKLQIDRENLSLRAQEAAVNMSDKMQLMNLTAKYQQARAGVQQAQASKDPQAIKAAEANLKSVQQDVMDHHAVYDKGAGGGAAALADDDPSLYAQGATGEPLNQVVPGYGKTATAQRTQVRKGSIDYIAKNTPGMTITDAGSELAMRQIEYAGGKRSQSQLITALGGMEQAVSQLDYNIDQAKKEMKAMGVSDLSPLVNSIANQEKTWTGDPKLARLHFYMGAVANESARILSGGVGSVAQLHAGAAEEAKKWANTTMTGAMLDGVGDAMNNEGQFRIKSYKDAMQKQRDLMTHKEGGTGKSLYHVGDEFYGADGIKYRVTGGDMTNPEVEPSG